LSLVKAMVIRLIMFREVNLERWVGPLKALLQAEKLARHNPKLPQTLQQEHMLQWPVTSLRNTAINLGYPLIGIRSASDATFL
jgi:hypothetical protein